MTDRGLAAVTGSSRGLGKAIAFELARLGFDVLLISRPSKELSDTAYDIAAQTGRYVDVAHADLLDEEACVASVRGRTVNVLVNCGIYQGPAMNARVDQLSSEELRRTFQANVLTQVAMIREVLPGMLKRGNGRIFQLVSGSSRVKPIKPVDKGGFQAFGYTGPKSAIAKLVPLLALENAEVTNVRFFNIDPGLVITDKMRAEGTAEKFAKWGAASPEATSRIVGILSTTDDQSLLEQLNGAEFVDSPALSKSLLSKF